MELPLKKKNNFHSEDFLFGRTGVLFFVSSSVSVIFIFSIVTTSILPDCTCGAQLQFVIPNGVCEE